MIPRAHHPHPGREQPLLVPGRHRALPVVFGSAAVVLALILLALLLPAPALAVPDSAPRSAALPTIPAPTATAPSSTTTTSPLVLEGQAKTQVDSLSAQAAAVQADIDSLDARLELSSEAYNELVVKLDRTNARLADLRRQLGDAQADYDAHLQRLEERLVSAYKSGGRDGLLPMLFLSDGLEDLYKRILLISQLAEQDRELVQNLKASRARLGGLLAEIDGQKAEQLSLRGRMALEREEIETTLAERRSTLAGLSSEIKAVIEQERKRQAEEQERLKQTWLGSLNGGVTYSTTVPQNGVAVLDQLVQTAVFYLGIPYVWAGERPATGFDCSGFTRYVFAQHGIDLPHYSGYQAQMGMPVEPQDIQAGDLVAFGNPVHHVGIYVGDGLFIHAPRTGDVVKLQPLSERTNLSAIRRFPLEPRSGDPAVW